MDHSPEQMPLHGIDPLQGKRIFVRKRDGRIDEFNEARISLAIESAFKAVEGVGRDARLPGRLQLAAKTTAGAVVEKLIARALKGERLEVERIQDSVEEHLMSDGHLEVARRYILYREKRRQARAEREGRENLAFIPPLPIPAAQVPVPSHPAAEPLSTNGALLEEIYSQALPASASHETLETIHRKNFITFLNHGEYMGAIAGDLLEFDINRLANALCLTRDGLIPAKGLDLLQKEFFLQDKKRCIETPQYFWMRVAMGLALVEGEQRTDKAIKFYDILSLLRFIPSEQMLAHAGTTQPYFVSCCTATNWADLEHVTPHRGPRLENHSDSGSACSALEPWHINVFEFLARPACGEIPLNQNLNKALWVPDLFLQRVKEKGTWTLFEPATVPELHRSFGREFTRIYETCEARAQRGQISGWREISAAELWCEILACLSQTGQPWLGFKDAVNLRSPQDQTGTICNTSLCTSIFLNHSASAASVCSSGAINLAAHVKEGEIDRETLRETVTAAIRMLDNAIDAGLYPNAAARAASLKYRPVGLGLFGFQDALDRMNMLYGSAAAAEFADRTAEFISARAISASTSLALERGAFPAYDGSRWSQGIIPLDTIELLAAGRAGGVDISLETTEDWAAVRGQVLACGMRHCAVTAIGQTEAAAKIAGVCPSIEPRTLQETGALWLIECAARRQKWLDMGQALTLYINENEFSTLSELYLQAWEKGLKSTRQLVRLPYPDKKENTHEKGFSRAVETPAEALAVK